MSAEVLRRAAALMRERVDVMKRESGLLIAAAASEIPWFDLTDDYLGLDADVHSHIASWHPAVALAVAAWLDETALRWEYVEERELALAVARTYLNDQETP